MFKGARDLSHEGLWTIDQSANYLKVSRRQLERYLVDPFNKSLNTGHIVRKTPTSRPRYLKVEDVKKFKHSDFMGND